MPIGAKNLRGILGVDTPVTVNPGENMEGENRIIAKTLFVLLVGAMIGVLVGQYAHAGGRFYGDPVQAAPSGGKASSNRGCIEISADGKCDSYSFRSGRLYITHSNGEKERYTVRDRRGKRAKKFKLTHTIDRPTSVTFVFFNRRTGEQVLFHIDKNLSDLEYSGAGFNERMFISPTEGKTFQVLTYTPSTVNMHAKWFYIDSRIDGGVWHEETDYPFGKCVPALPVEDEQDTVIKYICWFFFKPEPGTRGSLDFYETDPQHSRVDFESY